MNPIRIATLLSLASAAFLAEPCAAQAPMAFTISQPLGGDNFGARATGQTFTPGVGVMPDASAFPALPLAQITLYQGNSGANSPSATTYLNIYDGDPNAGGNFVGSSTDFVDTNGPVFHTPMHWHFSQIPLLTATEYWAVLSSTDTAGNLDVECSLENQNRNTPNPYAGGAGLIANIVRHPALNDTKFEIRFFFGALGTFTSVGTGCPTSTGSVVDLRLQDGTPPAIGQTMTFEVANAPANEPLSFVVLGAMDPGGIDLGVIGMPGCPMHVDGFAALQAPTAGNGVGTASLPLPNDMALVGASFFAQPLVRDAAVNAFGAVTGNAKLATIGQ